MTARPCAPVSRGPWTILAILAFVSATRVLGLSLVVPVFPLHGATLTSSFFLVAVAFGAYAVSMALFQIPFGILSDRWGRKRAILAGLAVSAVGTVACAFANDVWTLALARLVAGAGAVSGVAFALIGEIFPPERRTQAMAIAGISTGLAFPIGLLAGSVLAPALGARGLFLANAWLVVVAIAIALSLPENRPSAREPWRATLRALASPAQRRLNLNGFALNFFRDAVLFTAPLVVLRFAPAEAQWRYLGPAILIGGLAMGASARLADRGHARAIVLASLVALAAGGIALLHATDAVAFVVLGSVFFAGHASLSATLPSLVQRAAPEAHRGAAQGALQLSQYVGLAAGAFAAGAWFPGRGLDLALALVAAGAILAFARLR